HLVTLSSSQLAVDAGGRDGQVAAVHAPVDTVLRVADVEVEDQPHAVGAHRRVMADVAEQGAAQVLPHLGLGHRRRAGADAAARLAAAALVGARLGAGLAVVAALALALGATAVLARLAVALGGAEAAGEQLEQLPAAAALGLGPGAGLAVVAALALVFGATA